MSSAGRRDDADMGKVDLMPASPQLRFQIQESLGLSSSTSTPEADRRSAVNRSSSDEGSAGRFEAKRKTRSIWQSFRKAQKSPEVPGSVRQINRGDSVGFVASEITMSDEERIQLMMMVKENMISIEEALARLKEFEVQNRQTSRSDPVEPRDPSSSSTNESFSCTPSDPDNNQEDLLTFRRLHKLVLSGRKVKKKPVRGEESGGQTAEEGLNADDPPCPTEPRPPAPAEPPPDVLQEQLASDGVNPSLSPSGLSPAHDRAVASGDTRAPGESCSFPDPEGCGAAEPRLTRSVTDGELRPQLLCLLSHHGRACSFGGFDLCSRAPHAAAPEHEDEETDGGVGRSGAARVSLSRKVRSVRETMRKHMSRRCPAPRSHQSSPDRVSSCPHSPHPRTHGRRPAEAGGFCGEPEELAERTQLHERTDGRNHRLLQQQQREREVRGRRGGGASVPGALLWAGPGAHGLHAEPLRHRLPEAEER
ncbi:hypothetical protein OJAV_G00218890 [Oryzias javanicus]|uniref:SLy proteins associated disordered region domain-containing protein n=1 Tax=Oryzias javanicus TaxID=123683 RepID=A0A437C4S8_ORYJA|nr:hypothetical protein OJAV_G00218890 [Oryzias javanicus]